MRNCTVEPCLPKNCSNTSVTGTDREECVDIGTENIFSPTLQALFIIVLLVMMASAVLGNTVVCYIVCKKPAMRSSINLLLANLALVDILIALFCMGASFVTLAANDWVFGHILCKMNAFCLSFFVTESTYILLAISWDRYLIIVCRQETLTPRKAKFVIALTWAISFLLSFPPTVGWGDYVYKRGHVICALNDDAYSYSLFFYTLTIVIPLLVMGFVYHRILCTVRKNSTKIVNHPPVSGAQTRIHKSGKMSINYGFKTRAFLTILILFVGYIICFLPYLVARLDAATGRHLKLTTLTEVVIIFICYLNSAINPLVYYTRISKFREACRDIVPSWCCSSMPCTPKRPRRRIFPHVIYEVGDSNERSISFNGSSLGVFN
ncbi:high-affinity lysophosphatidic acid receptor-like [Xenia sp. Carnegie-2017]|uniref:high-affinity lysophosphatidic acid receptor-like n=1 Tax=Xenia sp. Carnegie-2017 TaxID=2897299 RepID=UPI001F040D1B|nr:high-affinity lysophosphatidic acid receptor-like [Xenia sp. Carnegie-2017]